MSWFILYVGVMKAFNLANNACGRPYMGGGGGDWGGGGGGMRVCIKPLCSLIKNVDNPVNFQNSPVSIGLNYVGYSEYRLLG